MSSPQQGAQDLKLNMWLTERRFGTDFNIRIFEVKSLSDPDDSAGIERIADSLSFARRGKTIAAGIGGLGYPAVAVVTSEGLPQTFDVDGEPKHVLSLRESSFAIDFSRENHRRALGNILTRGVRSHLRQLLGKKLWQRSDRSRIYCLLEPEVLPSEGRDREADSAYDLFRGFTYRIDVFPDGRVGLSLDVCSTVLDGLSLSRRIEEGGVETFPSDFKNQYMVLADKDGRLKVRFVRDMLTDQTVKSFGVRNEYGGSVSIFDDFKGRHPRTGSQLDQTDRVILYSNYSEDTRNLYAPASCFYDILNNSELEEDRNLKRSLIIPANERFQKVVSYRLEFLGLKNPIAPGINMVFGKGMCGTGDFKAGVFPLPSLEFGKDGILKPSAMANRNEWRVVKERQLSEYGAYRHSNIGSILLIHPKGPEEEYERFYHDLIVLAEKWDEKLPQKYTPLQTQDYSDILPNIEMHQSRYDAAIVVFREWDEETYRRVKGTLKIPSQGVRLSTLRSRQRLFESEREGHYWDTLSNILSGLLGKSGAIPWVMAEPLSCDCYIGVDSGGSESRVWSYAYVFDRTGEHVGSEKGQAYKRESIEKGRFKNSIMDALDKYPVDRTEKEGPERVVIHRDGRLTKTEKDGLNEALGDLKNNNRLSENVNVAAVDVKKTHSFRIFERGSSGFENPFLGSYFLLDENRAIVNTTGVPVLNKQGTAKPLLLDLDVIAGKFTIEDITRDVFYLSELNWGSPKMDTKMPITIRFAEKRIFYADKNIDYSDQIPL